MRKAQEFIIKGMNRDLSISKFNPEFAYENMNIRITARDSNTLLSITNEKGNKKIPLFKEYTPNAITSSVYVDLDTDIHSRTFESELPLDGPVVVEITVPDSTLTPFRVTINNSDLGITKFNLPAEYNSQSLLTRCNVVEQAPVTNVCYCKQANYTQEIPTYEETVSGVCIGKQVLNDYLVLFTIDDVSRIYRLKRADSGFSVVSLYAGVLGFDRNHPIQSIGIYENEDIQKVYWTDGINPPRVINISADVSQMALWNDNSFDFISNLKLNEDITITKAHASSGVFPSGVVQYAFSYYNRYGKQSNIFYTSPLNYITALDRGLSPEDNASIGFDIEISDADKNFQYIRIYSILRTSIDAVPVAKVVADIPLGNMVIDKTINTSINTITTADVYYVQGGNSTPIQGQMYVDAAAGEKIYMRAEKIRISSTEVHEAVLYNEAATRYRFRSTTSGSGRRVLISSDQDTFNVSYTANKIKFTDTNTSGYTIDPTELLYIGGEDIVYGCMCHKDNTLFMGDIKLNRNNISGSDLEKAVKSLPLAYSSKVLGKFTDEGYAYDFQLNSSSWDITTFKYLETYRFGIQAQHKSGKWSEVLFVKDLQNTVLPTTTNGQVSGSKATLTVPANINKILLDKGYVKIRGVVVYPTIYERSVLCQGYVQPTMYNTQDRINDNPFSIPSWQLRLNTDSWMNNYISQVPVNESGRAEIAYDIYDQVPYYEDRNGEGRDVYLSKFGDKYYVDLSICNLFSPELEASDSIDNMDLSSYDFRIVGSVQFNRSITDFYLDMESQQQDREARGFIKSMPTGMFGNYPMFEDTIANTWEVWKNILPAEEQEVHHPADSKSKGIFHMHLWQGSENIGWHYVEGKETDAFGKIKRKVISQIQWCGEATYTDSPYTPYTSIVDKQVCASDEMSLTKLNTSSGTVSYYQNVDKLQHSLVAKSYNTSSLITKEKGYPQRANKQEASLFYNASYFYRDDKSGSYSPVRIKYKTAKHIVFSFGASGTTQYTMPTPSAENSDSSSAHKWPWSTPITGWVKPYLKIGDYSDIWIGEFYKKDPPTFGGTSEQALLENKWVAAGPAVMLNANFVTTVEYLQGDTYFQRWDSLRLSPMTSEDFNSNIQIVSFMCESRVNLDGRYDRNRGIAGLALSDKNFNLMNPVYSQKDNFFQPLYLDKKSQELDTFPNVITWSKTKTLAEEIDSWTNITLASTLDLDGDKGRVRALEVYNNDILAFQDNALSHVLFNSRVQMTTSDNVPIEIANSGKVDGKRYISNHIGTLNKFAIINTPSGIFFEDNNSNSIYLFNGQLNDLSDAKGFRSWANEVIMSNEFNKPLEEVMTSHYDKSNGDVYFNTPKYCLSYSTLLGTFTSFYSYEAVPYMFNIQDSFYAIKNGSTGCELWEQFKGDYNYFFGKYKPFYVHLMANPDMPNDKVFDTLEFRADSFDEEGNLTQETFDNLYTWDEYQEGHASLNYLRYEPSTLKRKFRVWRAVLPRDSKRPLNRMRNTWLNIKLSKERDNKLRTILHDMTLHYTV